MCFYKVFKVVLIFVFYADNFHKVLSSTLVHQQVNFNFDSTFVKQYFGTDHSHELSYEEFVQLLQVCVGYNWSSIEWSDVCLVQGTNE